MKWLIALVLLLTSVSASAQDAPMVAPELIGAGWVVSTTSNEDVFRKTVYVGPEGASVILESYHLPGGMFDSALRVQMMLISWRVHASGSAPDGTEVPLVTDVSPPNGVTDASRSEWIDPAKSVPIGYSIYGIQAANVLMVIRTEGTVNGLTGVAAADYVAGLYFAALSDQ